jgi:dipeptidyl aminopeptidase/acylaminoacyl peptidase
MGYNSAPEIDLKTYPQENHLTDVKRLITPEDIYSIKSIEDPRFSPDGKWIAYVLVTPDKLENGYTRNIWVVATAGGKPIQLTRSGKDSQPRWSPDGTYLTFTSSRNEKPQIYLLPLQHPGGEARALTTLPNGANNPAWSPDGNQIAFLSPLNAEERAQEDNNTQEPAPLDKLAGKHRKERRDLEEGKKVDPRVVERIPYRAGTSYLSDRFAQIYIVSVAEDLPAAEKRLRRLTSLNADHKPPVWTPDGKAILSGRISDPQRDEAWRWGVLVQLDVATGVETILTDESFASLQPLPSPTGDAIAYLRVPREQLSERSTRLTVMPIGGDSTQAVDVVSDLDRSVADFRWVPDGSGILFTTPNEGNVTLYRVNLDDGSIERLMEETLIIESFDIHPEAGIAYCASHTDNPSDLYWRESSVDASAQMTQINQSLLKTLHQQTMHELHWKTPDGDTVHGWYMLPHGYEDGKQYPLIVNIHGGPHIMWGPTERSMWHEWQYQAAQGYIAFFCNPHGSDGYGEQFQMAAHGNWGDRAVVDILGGIDALLAQGLVDSQRIAVTGGSYGGYMTAWLLAKTERFIAGVAQRGVYNLLSFTGVTDITSYIPNEFGMEAWDDPHFLWEHSPLAHAHKIKVPLLILHAEHDYRVPISEAEQLFTYVRRSGGTVKLIRYPRDGHEMTRAGEPAHRVHSLQVMLDWFNQYCYPNRNATPKDEA